MSTTMYRVINGQVTGYEVTEQTNKGYKTACGRTLFKFRPYGGKNAGIEQLHHVEITVADQEEANIIASCQRHKELKQAEKHVKGLISQDSELNSQMRLEGAMELISVAKASGWLTPEALEQLESVTRCWSNAYENAERVSIKVVELYK